MKKRTDLREILFREILDRNNNSEVRLYKRNKRFLLERIHNKNAMSVDYFDDPEVAYHHYEYLIKNRTTKFPYEYERN